MQKPVIVVHGGAGAWQPERIEARIKGVKEAAKAGFKILKHNGNALDAVEAAGGFTLKFPRRIGDSPLIGVAPMRTMNVVHAL